jgi:transcription elongation factor/antiterminator RfaH
MSYWSVAVTKPSGENRASLNLTRQGYLSYLPKYLSRVGKEIKVKILFPRYIFVLIESQWHTINSTFGVSRLILNNESKPAIVQDRIIDDLKMKENDQGFISLPEPPKFSRGENVRVVNGSFVGYSGLYDGMRDRERARILINLLGQQVRVELDEKDLASVVTVGSKG